MKKYVLSALSVLFIASCKPQPDVKIAEQLARQNAKLSEVIKSKNLKLLDEVYDENAWYMSPGDTLVQGIKAIKEKWSNGLENMTEMHSETLEIIGQGELVTEVGIVQTVINLPDTAFTYKAKYANVWKKDPQGNYKLKVDIWNQIE